MKPDFNAMTKAELKAYLLEHRNDQEAFYIYMDKLKTSPVIAVHSPSDTEPLSSVIERIRNAKTQSSKNP